MLKIEVLPFTYTSQVDAPATPATIQDNSESMNASTGPAASTHGDPPGEVRIQRGGNKSDYPPVSTREVKRWMKARKQFFMRLLPFTRSFLDDLPGRETVIGMVSARLHVSA